MNTVRSIVNHILGQPTAVLNPDICPGRNHNHRAQTGDRQGRSQRHRALVTPDPDDAGFVPPELTQGQQGQSHDRADQGPISGEPEMANRSAILETLWELHRLNRDLALAEEVQKRLLPQSVPLVPSFEFFAHYDPMYEVGGDFYDFIRLPDHRLAVAVGDVSGNGVAAGLLMARFSGETRRLMLAGYSTPAAAELLNGLLFESGIDEAFITLSLSVLDITTRTLSLISAGHPLVMIRRANGTVDEVGAQVAGTPLGIVSDANYQQAEVALQAGDVVVVFSDGVTDARNGDGELYDSRVNRRLLGTIAQTLGGPKAMGRAILQDIHEFTSGQFQADDVTLLCFGPLVR
jgi:phosphoserine phosphatase RsbU/P